MGSLSLFFIMLLFLRFVVDELASLTFLSSALAIGAENCNCVNGCKYFKCRRCYFWFLNRIPWWRRRILFPVVHLILDCYFNKLSVICYAMSTTIWQGLRETKERRQVSQTHPSARLFIATKNSSLSPVQKTKLYFLLIFHTKNKYNLNKNCQLLFCATNSGCRRRRERTTRWQWQSESAKTFTITRSI